MTTEIQTLATLELGAKAGATLPDSGPAPRPRGVWILLCGPASALLLALCYFPVDWGWLGWVALVPLLGLVRANASRLRIYGSAWLGGLLFFWPALQWLRVADDRMYYTWGALATYCSLYFPLGIWLVRLLDRRARLPLVVAVPVVWTALELLRAHLMTGFPWYFLSHTQHDFLALTQIADLGGAYAVTFVVAAVNALVFECLFRSGLVRALFHVPQDAPVPGWRSLGVSAAAVGLLVGLTYAYGVMQLQHHDFAEGPRVALIQSNLDQRIRVAAAAGNDAARSILAHNCELTDSAARANPRPDLIVWPETSYPGDWTEMPAGLSAGNASIERREELERWRQDVEESRKLALLTARRWKTNVMLGMNAAVMDEAGKDRRYNSALLIQADGKKGGRYDKMHRVPFGEYVPLRDWLPWMNQFAPYDHDYSVAAGETFSRFPLGDHSFGVVICYEDTDPALGRQYVGGDGGPPVDFLVNISNDGWFDGTEEHEQHLAICRFRAIECRRAIVRAVNMGVSAVIDSNGRVLKPTRFPSDADHEHRTWAIPDHRQHALPVADWKDYRKVAGVLSAAVPLDTRTSFYARFGDWLPGLCWLIIGLGIVRAAFCSVRG